MKAKAKANYTLGLILLVLIVILVAAAWIVTITQAGKAPEDSNDISGLLEKAAAYEAQEIYYDAGLLYEEALDIVPNHYDVWMKYADSQMALGKSGTYTDACESAMEVDPNRVEAYEKLMTYDIERGEFSAAAKLMKQADQLGVDSELISSIRQKLKDTCSVKYSSYQQTRGWHNGMAAVKSDQGWGIQSSDGGGIELKAKFDEIGGYDNQTGFIPVCEEGHWYFRDMNDYKRREPYGPCSWLGTFGNGLAPAQNSQGKCGYLDTDMRNAGDFIYEEAKPFLNGVAAVKMNGKWGLIAADMSPITECIYDEIVMDDYGFCSRQKRIFAKQGNTYLLLDEAGKQVGNDRYEEVDIFFNYGWAAVKKDGSWCAIDTDGTVKLTTSAKELKSFNNGLAAASDDGVSWYYITTEGAVWHRPELEATCQGLGYFLSNGYYYIKLDGQVQVAQLYYYP